MTEKLLQIKTAIVAGFTALGIVLGWKGILLFVWLAAMILDYISGTAAACKSRTWSSAVARQGLWHKGGMILVVLVAFIADGVMLVIMNNIPGIGIAWPGLVFPTVLAWYIITEFGSVLENAVKLGAAVPLWLTKLLKISFKAINTNMAPEDPEELSAEPPDDPDNGENNENSMY